MKNFYIVEQENIEEIVGYDLILAGEFIRPVAWYGAPQAVYGSDYIAIGHFMDDHAPCEPHLIVTQKENTAAVSHMLAAAACNRIMQEQRPLTKS